MGVTSDVTGNDTSSQKDGIVGHLQMKTIVQSCQKQACRRLKLSFPGSPCASPALLSILLRDVISAKRLINFHMDGRETPIIHRLQNWMCFRMPVIIHPSTPVNNFQLVGRSEFSRIRAPRDRKRKFTQSTYKISLPQGNDLILYKNVILEYYAMLEQTSLRC